MTEELSDSDMNGLAKQNVGLLPEVAEAFDMLAATVPALKRARKKCCFEARVNLQKFMNDGNDTEADMTVDKMYSVDEKIRRIMECINELSEYI